MLIARHVKGESNHRRLLVLLLVARHPGGHISTGRLKPVAHRILMAWLTPQPGDQVRREDKKNNNHQNQGADAARLQPLGEYAWC